MWDRLARALALKVDAEIMGTPIPPEAKALLDWAESWPSDDDEDDL